MVTLVGVVIIWLMVTPFDKPIYTHDEVYNNIVYATNEVAIVVYNGDVLPSEKARHWEQEKGWTLHSKTCRENTCAFMFYRNGN